MDKKAYLYFIALGGSFLAWVIGCCILCQMALQTQGWRANYNARVTELTPCYGLDTTQEPIPMSPLAAGMAELKFCGRVDGEGKIPLWFILRYNDDSIDDQEIYSYPGHFVAGFTSNPPGSGFAAGKYTLLVYEHRNKLAVMDFVIQVHPSFPTCPAVP